MVDGIAAAARRGRWQADPTAGGAVMILELELRDPPRIESPEFRREIDRLHNRMLRVLEDLDAKRARSAAIWTAETLEQRRAA
jgi:hypothetical protein